MDIRESRPLRAFGTLFLLLLTLLEFGMLASSTAAPPTRREVEDAQNDLDAAVGNLRSVQTQVAEAEAELTKIRTRANNIQSEVKQIARRVLDEEKAAVKVARELYMSGSAAVLSGLLSSESIADLESGLTYLQSTGEAHLSEIDSLVADRKLLEARLDELDRVRDQAATIAADIRRLADALSSVVDERRAEVADLRESRAEYEEQVAQAQEAAAAVEEQARTLTEPPEAPPGPYSVNWDAIAQCESGGNWALDGEYDGGLQFHPATWLGYGGGKYARYAWQATREQQIAIAEKVLAAQGPSAWPNCFQYGD
jgi:peptidoglycan hydrolase CwlO-like protein